MHRTWQPLTSTAVVLNLAGRYQEAEGYARELIALCDAMHWKEVVARRADSLSRLGAALIGQHRYRDGIEVLERSARAYEQAGPIWTKRAAEIRTTINEKRARAN